MAGKRRASASPSWPFGRKVDLWLADHGLSLNAFAKRLGVAQSTIHGWVKQGSRVPAEGLRKVALATRLPADYWINPDLPYPPPSEYLDLAGEVEKALQGLSVDQLVEVLRMLQDPEDLRRTLALRKAAKS